ncbi:hypothetical protein JCM10207_003618 [Rhodosporidiobolus poonsookiae]
MSASTKPNWKEMVEASVSIHHELKKHDKASRKRVYDYLHTAYGVDMGNENCREKFKKALEDAKSDGNVEQDKQSFIFTPQGEKYFSETYDISDESEEEDDSAKKSPSTKKTASATAGKKKK